MSNPVNLNKSMQVQQANHDLLDSTRLDEPQPDSPDKQVDASTHRLNSSFSFSKADQKLLESIVNEGPDDAVPSSKTELTDANELTEKLQEDDALRRTVGTERRVKIVSELPEPVQKVLIQSRRIQSELEATQDIKQKVQRLALLQATLEQLQHELDRIDPKADNKDLQTTELLKEGMELERTEDSLAASQAILAEIAKAKEHYPQVHEAILANTELSECDRAELLDFEARVLQDNQKNVLLKDSAFQAILAQSTEPDDKRVLEAASLVLARIVIENPDQKEPLTIADLFSSYRQSHDPKTLPEDLGKDAETRMAASFKHDLIALANASGSASGLDAKAFCETVDRFAGFDLAHFAVVGNMLKNSLAPSFSIRQRALAQHTYQIALKTLFAQLPKKDIVALRAANLTQALTGEGIDALRGLKQFKDLSNQIVALVVLQNGMIREGLVDLEDVSKGLPGVEHLNLQAKDDANVRLNQETVAFALEKRLSQSLDNVGLYNLIETCRDVPFFDPKTGIIAPEHQQVIDKLNAIGADYLERSIRGMAREVEVAKHLKSVSKSLTGTYFSGNYLRKVYDLNISNKSARVMDGVFRELTGVLDPSRRGVLQSGDHAVLQLLKDEMQATIDASLRGDAVDRLRVKTAVGKEKAAQTLEALLFDRVKAKEMGFQIKSTRSIDLSAEEVLKQQTDAYSRIEGTRRRIIQSIKNEADFAEQNGLAVEAHKLKKEVNATYKARKATADKVHTFFWSWHTRRANAGKILELKSQYDKLRNLDPTLSTEELAAREQELQQAQERVSTLFNELKSLNLSNFADKDSKEFMSVDEFLEKALPLAEAIDYMQVSGRAKEDYKLIKDLKKIRNEARGKLDDYVKEAKKAYGADIIRQIQRTVVLAAYFSELENPGVLNDYESRLEGARKFLKENFPSMARCDEGILGELVKDALRRYTPPVGPMTHRCLDRIEARLGSEHADSERVKKEEDAKSKEMLKEYKTLANQMYMKRGIDGLMEMIQEPGRGFSYNKQQSFTLSSAPAFMQGSLSFMPNESFCVTHTDEGYRVLVKSANAVKIAASVGFKFGHGIKQLGMIKFEAKAEGSAKFGEGLELFFKNPIDVRDFVEDFMDPASKMHKGELYNPTWHKSADMKQIREKVFSGSIGASAKAMLRLKRGETYTNQLHFGTQDYSKAKTLNEYVGMLNPTNGGNQIAQFSVKLPSAKVEASLSGSHTSIREKSRETTTKRTSSTAKLDVQAQLTPVQFRLHVMPACKMLWAPINSFYESGEGKELVDDLVKAFLEVDKSLTGEKQKLIQDKISRALGSIKVGEIDDANDLLEEIITVAAPEAIERFTSMSTNRPEIKCFQQVMKILQVDASLSQIGVFKAGGPQGKSNDRGHIRAGVKLDLAPSSILPQVAKQYYQDVVSENTLPQNIDAKGNAAKGQNKQDPSVLQKVVQGIETVGTFASTIENIIMGNPMFAAANLIGMTLGSSQIELKATDRVKSTVDINAKDLVSYNKSYRGKTVEADFKAGLLTGVSAHAAVNFTGTAKTEHIESYNKEKHQYTDATGIDYKLTKSKFTLDNLLDLLNLPEAVAAELRNDTVLMTALLKTFLSAGPNDVFTLKTRLSPEALKQVNALELRKSTRPESAKEIEKQIRRILETPENYVPVAFNVTHNDVKELRLAFEMSEIDLGVLSFGHHRDFTTTKSTTLSLRGLKSVQNQLDGKTVFESPIAEDFEATISEETPETEVADHGGSLHPKNTVEASKQPSEPVNAPDKASDSGHALGALPAFPTEVTKDTLKDFSSGLRAFIEANKDILFGGDAEALNRLLDKIRSDSNQGFLTDLAQLSSQDALRTRLLETFEELKKDVALDNEVATNTKAALLAFGSFPVPVALGKRIHEQADFKSRVRFLLSDRDNYKHWMKDEPTAERSAGAYLKWTTSQALSKLLSERDVTGSQEGSFIATDVYPTIDSPIQVGQTFSQNTNTCFMMSIANALAATERGAKLLNAWLKTKPSINSELNDSRFSTFEQQLASLYKNFVNVNGSMKWNQLGEMGESDAMGLALGLDSLGETRAFDANSQSWQLRELWYDISKALHDEKIVTVFTPGHYRAIVGTYGDPQTNDFGFVIRDSNKSGASKQYPVSAAALVGQGSLVSFNILTLPDQNLEKPWDPENTRQLQSAQGAQAPTQSRNPQEPLGDGLKSETSVPAAEDGASKDSLSPIENESAETGAPQKTLEGRRSEYVNALVVDEEPFKNPLLLAELKERLHDHLEHDLTEFGLAQSEPKDCVDFFLEGEKQAIRNNLKVKEVRNYPLMQDKGMDPTKLGKPVAPGDAFPQGYNACFIMSLTNALASKQGGATHLNQWIQGHCKSAYSDQDNNYSDFERHVLEDYQKKDPEWGRLKYGDVNKVAEVFGLKDAESSVLTHGAPEFKQRQFWCDVGSALRSDRFVTLFDGVHEHYVTVVGTYGDPYAKADAEFGFVVRDTLFDQNHKKLDEQGLSCVEYSVSVQQLVPNATEKTLVANIFYLPETKQEQPDGGLQNRGISEGAEATHDSKSEAFKTQPGSTGQTAEDKKTQTQPAPESTTFPKDSLLGSVDLDLKEGDFSPDTGINDLPKVVEEIHPRLESWYRKLIAGEHAPRIDTSGRIELYSIRRQGLTETARIENAKKGFKDSVKAFLDLFDTPYVLDMNDLVYAVHQGLQYEAWLRDLGQAERTFLSEVGIQLQKYDLQSKDSSGASPKKPFVHSIREQFLTEQFDAVRTSLRYEFKVQPDRKDLLAVSEFLEEFSVETAGMAMLRKSNAMMLAEFISEDPFDPEYFRELFLQDDKLVGRLIAHRVIDATKRESPFRRFSEPVRSMSNEQLAVFWERLVSKPVEAYAKSLNGSSDATEQAMAQWFFDMQALVLKIVEERTSDFLEESPLEPGTKALDDSFDKELADTVNMVKDNTILESDDISVDELRRRVEDASKKANGMMSLTEAEQKQSAVQNRVASDTQVNDEVLPGNIESGKAQEAAPNKTDGVQPKNRLSRAVEALGKTGTEKLIAALVRESGLPETEIRALRGCKDGSIDRLVQGKIELCAKEPELKTDDLRGLAKTSIQAIIEAKLAGIRALREQKLDPPFEEKLLKLYLASDDCDFPAYFEKTRELADKLNDGQTMATLFNALNRPDKVVDADAAKNALRALAKQAATLFQETFADALGADTDSEGQAHLLQAAFELALHKGLQQLDSFDRLTEELLSEMLSDWKPEQGTASIPRILVETLKTHLRLPLFGLGIGVEVITTYGKEVFAVIQDEYRRMLASDMDFATIRKKLKELADSTFTKRKDAINAFLEVKSQCPTIEDIETIDVDELLQAAIEVDHDFLDPNSSTFQIGMRLLADISRNFKGNDKGVADVLRNVPFPEQQKDLFQLLLCFGRSTKVTIAEHAKILSMIPRMRAIQPKEPITAETFLRVMFGTPVPQPLLDAKGEVLQDEIARRLIDARRNRFMSEGRLVEQGIQHAEKHLRDFCSLGVPFETAFAMALERVKNSVKYDSEIRKQRDKDIEEYRKLQDNVEAKLEYQSFAIENFFDWLTSDFAVMDFTILQIEQALADYPGLIQDLSNCINAEDEDIEKTLAVIDQLGDAVAGYFDNTDENPVLQQRIMGMYARFYSIALAAMHYKNPDSVTLDQVLALREKIQGDDHRNAQLFLDALAEYTFFGRAVPSDEPVEIEEDQSSEGVADSALTPEIVERYGETTASLVATTADAMQKAGNPKERILEVAENISNEVQSFDLVLQETAKAHTNWSADASEAFIDAMHAALRQNPVLLDCESPVFIRVRDKLCNILDGANGEGAYFSQIRDSDQRKDLLQLVACFGLNMNALMYHQARIHLALPQMRKLQPEGPITPETFFRACFGSDVPSKFQRADYQERQEIVGEIIDDEQKTALECVDKDDLLSLRRLEHEMYVGAGIPYQMAIERVLSKAKDKDSFVDLDVSKTTFVTELSFPKTSSVFSVENAEKQFFSTSGAGDFNRMVYFDLNGIRRYARISLPSEHGGTMRVDNRSVGTQFADTERNLKASLRAICLNDEQYRVLLWSLTQACPAQQAIKAFSSYIGYAMTEHAPFDIVIKRSENSGDLTVSFDLPPGFGIKFGATYVIGTTGMSRLKRFVCTKGEQISGEKSLEAEFADTFKQMDASSAVMIREAVLAEASKPNALTKLRPEVLTGMARVLAASEFAPGGVQSQDEKGRQTFLQKVLYALMADSSLAQNETLLPTFLHSIQIAIAHPDWSDSERSDFVCAMYHAAEREKALRNPESGEFARAGARLVEVFNHKQNGLYQFYCAIAFEPLRRELLEMLALVPEEQFDQWTDMLAGIRGLLTDKSMTQNFLKALLTDVRMHPQDWNTDIGSKFQTMVEAFNEAEFDASVSAPVLRRFLSIVRSDVARLQNSKPEDPRYGFFLSCARFAARHKGWSDEDCSDFVFAMREASIVNPSLLNTRSDAFKTLSSNLEKLFDNVDECASVYRNIEDLQVRRDFLQTVATFLDASLRDPILPVFLLDILPKMRAVQPNGAITQKTFWKTGLGCFFVPSNKGHGELVSEAMEEIQQKTFKALLKAASLKRDEDEFLDRANNRYLAEFSRVGIPFQVSVQRAAQLARNLGGEANFDVNQACFERNLRFSSEFNNGLDIEQRFRGDFSRTNLEREGDTLHSTLTVTNDRGKSKQFTSKVPPNPTNDGVIQSRIAKESEVKCNEALSALRALCGANTEQYRTLVMALTASTPLQIACRQFGLFYGREDLSEHMPLEISVSPDQSGNIVLSMSVPQKVPGTIEAKYLIHPDGSSDVNKFVIEL